LHTAAIVGDIETVKLLLEAGANCNALDDCTRKPLWVTVHLDHTDIVRLLLEITTDINDQAHNGATSLSMAAKWALKDCVQLLLEAGADIWC